MLSKNTAVFDLTLSYNFSIPYKLFIFEGWKGAGNDFSQKPVKPVVPVDAGG